MKTELVSFYVIDSALSRYSTNGVASLFSKQDRRLALYVGEDEEHIWLHPLFSGSLTEDKNQIPRIIISSVVRFVKDDVVIQEPQDQYFSKWVFGDMKYSAGSLL